MSAARKVSAWNLFRVTPNCLRVFRYSAVVPQRGVHGADRLVAVGDPRRGQGPLDRRGPVAGPRRAAPPGVPSKRTFAARRAVVGAVPGAGQARGVAPDEEQPGAAARRTALTTSTSARAPLGTGSLTPVSVQPSPSAWR